MDHPDATRVMPPAGAPGRAARSGLVGAGLVLLFVVGAVLNSGYRYGISDQAFYVPAVLSHIAPDLFPHDRSLLAAHDSLIAVTSALAAVARVTGLAVPSLFLAVFFVTLLVLGAALVALGRTVLGSSWAVAAFLAAATLRHRVTLTGVNTLEGYFHPRILAFAVGVAGLAAMLRGRPWLAAALAALTACLHPTTGLWFAVWIGVAVIVAEPAARRAFLVAAAVAMAASLWLVTLGPLHKRMVVMDSAWLSVLAVKDYLFPSEWPLHAWLVNLGYVAVILGIHLYRRRRGLTVARESGLIAGCLALVALFLAALPFVAARVALAVQLQVSRVFWAADLLATLYVVWLLAEGLPRLLPRIRPGRAARVATVLFLAASIGRGMYLTLVERRANPIVSSQLPAGPWLQAMEWIAARTPAGSHVLADPGHAWRYGVSVRVAARRDVFLEEVKDSALAIYSRDVALRVRERTDALGDFQQLTTSRALALAARYDLDYLVTDRPLDLPVAYRNSRFTVYTLRHGR